MCLAQKKVPANIHQSRSNKRNLPNNSMFFSDKPQNFSSMSVSPEMVTLEIPASSLGGGAAFRNLYGVIKTVTENSPIRSPSGTPTNLELAQVSEFKRICCNLNCKFDSMIEC